MLPINLPHVSRTARRATLLPDSTTVLLNAVSPVFVANSTVATAPDDG